MLLPRALFLHCSLTTAAQGHVVSYSFDISAKHHFVKSDEITAANHPVMKLSENFASKGDVLLLL